MIKSILPIFILFSTSVLAESDFGKVCFGKNIAKPASEYSDRLYIKIDDSKKIFFNRDYNGPVISDLDLKSDHIVKVYFDDKIGMSWKLNFQKLNTKSVVIWRSTGSWRMEPVNGEACK